QPHTPLTPASDLEEAPGIVTEVLGCGRVHQTLGTHLGEAGIGHSGQVQCRGGREGRAGCRVLGAGCVAETCAVFLCGTHEFDDVEHAAGAGGAVGTHHVGAARL